MEYLIDTDITIDYLKGKYALDAKFDSVGVDNIFLSEITIAELEYGAAKSSNREKHFDKIATLKSRFHVLPIASALRTYGIERFRLEKLGKRIEDFDLLIATSAVANNMTLVTGNEKHHARVEHIVIENWRLPEYNQFIQD